MLLVLGNAPAIAQDDVQTRLFRARDRALPALVNVRPVMDVFRGGRRRRATATGSGVIVREDGLVVTNFHVAGHAKLIRPGDSVVVHFLREDDNPEDASLLDMSVM